MVEYFISDSDESAEALTSVGPSGAGWRALTGPDPSVALTMLATLVSGVSFDEYLEEDDFCGLVGQENDTVVITVSRAVTDAILRIDAAASAAMFAEWAAAEESLHGAEPAELAEFVVEYQELAGEGFANQIYAWIRP